MYRSCQQADSGRTVLEKKREIIEIGEPGAGLGKIELGIECYKQGNSQRYRLMNAQYIPPHDKNASYYLDADALKPASWVRVYLENTKDKGATLPSHIDINLKEQQSWREFYPEEEYLFSEWQDPYKIVVEKTVEWKSGQSFVEYGLIGLKDKEGNNIPELGRGHYGAVFPVGGNRVLKVMVSSAYRQQTLKNLGGTCPKRECELLQQAHPQDDEKQFKFKEISPPNGPHIAMIGMPYIEMFSLYNLLKACGKLKVALNSIFILQAFRELLETVAGIHKRGVIHGDLIGNTCLTGGTDGRVKVIDYGFACDVNHTFHYNQGACIEQRGIWPVDQFRGYDDFSSLFNAYQRDRASISTKLNEMGPHMLQCVLQLSDLLTNIQRDDTVALAALMRVFSSKNSTEEKQKKSFEQDLAAFHEEILACLHNCKKRVPCNTSHNDASEVKGDEDEFSTDTVECGGGGVVEGKDNDEGCFGDIGAKVEKDYLHLWYLFKGSYDLLGEMFCLDLAGLNKWFVKRERDGPSQAEQLCETKLQQLCSDTGPKEIFPLFSAFYIACIRYLDGVKASRGRGYVPYFAFGGQKRVITLMKSLKACRTKENIYDLLRLYVNGKKDFNRFFAETRTNKGSFLTVFAETLQKFGVALDGVSKKHSDSPQQLAVRIKNKFLEKTESDGSLGFEYARCH